MRHNAEFDHAFRDKLGGHAEAPPPGMWDAIAGSLPTAPIKKRRGGALWFGLSSIALLIVTGFFGWYLQDADPSYSVRPTEEAQVSATGNTSVTGASMIALNIPVVQPGTHRSPTKATSVAIHHSSALKHSTINSPAPVSDPDVSTLAQFNSPAELSPLPTESPEVALKSADAEIVEVAGNDEPASAGAGTGSVIENAPDLAAIDSLVLDTNAIDPAITARAYRKLSRPDYVVGAFYLPEFGVHGNNSGLGDFWSQGGGLRLGIEHRGFVIESGIGLSSSRDSWDYSMDYLSRDSIGWFWDVVAVSFIPLINTQGDTIGYEPQYACVQANFYDSIQHNYSGRLSGTYSYVNIPFMIGVKRTMPGINSLSYALKAGVIYSKLWSSEDPVSPFDANAVRILSINDQSYLRRKSTLQWVVSSELRYSVSPRFSIFGEPMLRFYKDPYYLKEGIDDLAKPMSFSLRAGFLYKF